MTSGSLTHSLTDGTFHQRVEFSFWMMQASIDVLLPHQRSDSFNIKGFGSIMRDLNSWKETTASAAQDSDEDAVTLTGIKTESEHTFEDTDINTYGSTPESAITLGDFLPFSPSLGCVLAVHNVRPLSKKERDSEQKGCFSSEMYDGVYKRLKDKRLADRGKKTAPNAHQSPVSSVAGHAVDLSHARSSNQGYTATSLSYTEDGPKPCSQINIIASHGSPSCMQSDTCSTLRHSSEGQLGRNQNKTSHAFPPPPSLRLLHAASFSTISTSTTNTPYRGSISCNLLPSSPKDQPASDSQQRLHPLLSLPLGFELNASLCSMEATILVTEGSPACAPNRRLSLPEFRSCGVSSHQTEAGPCCWPQSPSHPRGNGHRVALCSVPIINSKEHWTLADSAMSSLSASALTYYNEEVL